jgi:hypothetical protein
MSCHQPSDRCMPWLGCGPRQAAVPPALMFKNNRRNVTKAELR